MDKLEKLTIENLRKSFDILWQAVRDREYNSRSILGDELLNMKDVFDEYDRHLTSQCSGQETLVIVNHPPICTKCMKCHWPDVSCH